jgi:hypothetical protein
MSVMEIVPWLFFCVVCLHLVFLSPYVILFPGSRVNAFSGLLCAVPLLAALPLVFKRPIRATAWELAVSLGLLIISLTSGWASSTPQDSTLRAMTLLTSGLGGFWCARILLQTEARQRLFAWLCTAGVAAIMALSLYDYPETGRVDYSLYTRSHPLIQMLLLLAVGPLSLVSRKRPAQSMLGVLALVGIYVALYLIGVDDTRSAVLIPVALVGVLALLAAFGSRLVPAALLLVLVTSAVVTHYALYTAPRGLLHCQEYRIESYPFSWHIAKKHPALGIGLRTSRNQFVEDYEVTTHDYPADLFAREVDFLVTSENVFLTLMVGLGLPFIALYGFALLVLLGRLLRLVFRPPPEEAAFHPLVLFLPLLGSILHSLTTDALLYPQINWYFHILLGLIPCRPAASTEPALGWKTVCLRAAATVLVAAFGIFLGTHQAVRPEGSAWTSPLSQDRGSASSMNSADRVTSRDASPGTGVATDGPTPPQRAGAVPRSQNRVGDPATESEVSVPEGELVVRLPDYVGSPVTWQVMVLLDNSETMTKEVSPWRPSRLAAAAEVASGLVGRVPDNAVVGLRYFSGRFSGRKDGRIMPLRMSLVLNHADREPPEALDRGGEVFREAGKNNLAAAALQSLGRDSAGEEGYLGRLVLVTDGKSQGAWSAVRKVIENQYPGTRTRMDVIALGMDPDHRQLFTELAEDSGGILLTVDTPTDVPSALARYLQQLRLRVVLPIEVRGLHREYCVMPGEPLKLPPGRYTIVVPPMEGLKKSARKIEEPVQIGAGETRVLPISVQEGRPVVH